MNRTKLLELADRCEKADGPDRELDALISAALRIGTEYEWAHNFPDWLGRSDGRVYLGDGGPSFAAKPYSASLDAAMSLVPEGCVWSVMVDYELPGRARIAGDDFYTRADASTPALALTASALKAHAEGAE